MAYSLFETAELGPLISKNRTVRSATNEHLSDPSGQITPAWVDSLEALARGGVGIIITGHLSVDRDQRADEGQAVLDRFPTAAVEAYHLDDVIHAVRPNLYTRQHEHVTHAGVEPVSALTDVPVPLVKIMFEDDHEHLTALRDYVLQQAWSENYEIFFSDRTLLEVTRKGASKGAMVARLAQRLGISPAHIYCAGDENNDLSMLTMAAEGFAPANCVETVRNCGATIVADCDHDTLAEIIAILDKRY